MRVLAAFDRVGGQRRLVPLALDDAPEKTAVCVLVDKEEIGSVGASGMAEAWPADRSAGWAAVPLAGPCRWTARSKAAFGEAASAKALSLIGQAR